MRANVLQIMKSRPHPFTPPPRVFSRLGLVGSAGSQILYKRRSILKGDSVFLKHTKMNSTFMKNTSLPGVAAGSTIAIFHWDGSINLFTFYKAYEDGADACYCFT
nr:uncharacterized protein LOC113814436 [Penaeus vannamei]